MIKLSLPNGSSWDIEGRDTREVYEHIADYLNPEYAKGNTDALTQEQHQIAADAEGWCELACICDYYEDPRVPGLSISIEED